MSTTGLLDQNLVDWGRSMQAGRAQPRPTRWTSAPCGRSAVVVDIIKINLDFNVIVNCQRRQTGVRPNVHRGPSEFTTILHPSPWVQEAQVCLTWNCKQHGRAKRRSRRSNKARPSGHGTTPFNFHWKCRESNLLIPNGSFKKILISRTRGRFLKRHHNFEFVTLISAPKYFITKYSIPQYSKVLGNLLP